jgi:hypothetical protein
VIEIAVHVEKERIAAPTEVLRCRRHSRSRRTHRSPSRCHQHLWQIAAGRCRSVTTTSTGMMTIERIMPTPRAYVQPRQNS